MKSRAVGQLSILIIVVFVAVVIVGLGDAFVPLLIATFLSYLLLPLVKKLESKGIKKEIAVACTVGVTALAVIATVLLLYPVVVEDLKAFALALPHIVETAVHKLDTYAMQMGVELPLNKEQLVSQMKIYMTEIPVGALKSLGLFFGKAFTGVAGVLLSVLNLLLVPIFFIYLVVDYEHIVKEARVLVPARMRPRFDFFLHRSNQIVSAYFRGQLLVAVILGFLYGLGFWAVGLRFGFVIGLLTGMMNVIPYAGPLVGLAVASTVAVANFSSMGSIVSVWIVFAIVQTLEGFVITPRVVGDRVGLNALQTMVALIVGGNLGGFLGMLVAIPAAGMAKLVLAESKSVYLKSDFYSGVESDRTT